MTIPHLRTAGKRTKTYVALYYVLMSFQVGKNLPQTLSGFLSIQSKFFVEFACDLPSPRRYKAKLQKLNGETYARKYRVT